MNKAKQNLPQAFSYAVVSAYFVDKCLNNGKLTQGFYYGTGTQSTPQKAIEHSACAKNLEVALLRIEYPPSDNIPIGTPVEIISRNQADLRPKENLGKPSLLGTGEMTVGYAFDSTAFPVGSYQGHAWRFWLTLEEAEDAYWGNAGVYFYKIAGVLAPNGSLDAVSILEYCGMKEAEPAQTLEVTKRQLELDLEGIKRARSAQAKMAGTEGHPYDPSIQALRTEIIKAKLKEHKLKEYIAWDPYPDDL
jgi:hypothetical protein